MASHTVNVTNIRHLIADIVPFNKADFGSNISDMAKKKALWLVRSRQRGDMIHILHPRVCLFTAHHGWSRAVERAESEKYLADCVDGRAPLPELCQIADCDLRLYEMGLDTPTRDIRQDSAMDDSGLEKAVAYGMMAVEPGVDLITTGAFGGGVAATGAALVKFLIEGHKDHELIQSVYQRGADVADDSLDWLCQCGGFEVAALTGLVLAARLAQIPVLLEGPAGLAALSVLTMLNPALGDHCAYTGPCSSAAQDWFATHTNFLFIPVSSEASLPGTESAIQIPHLKACLELERESKVA